MDNEHTKELETLKENIRRIRKEKGYRSAESFAEALGVSLKTVQGWENLDNGRWPDLSMLLKVCDLTGYDLDYFIGRLKEPTHDIAFIHEKTGLSVDAISKLISLKDTGMDENLSDIIVHNNSNHLLRVISLAIDKDEIEWLNLDELPGGLLSAGTGESRESSTGSGSDIAEFLASQELTSIVRDIRERRKSEKQSCSNQQDTEYLHSVHSSKTARMLMLEQLNESFADIYNTLNYAKHTDEETAKLKAMLNRIQNLKAKIQNASFAEWKRGEIDREYADMYGKGNE